MTPIVIEAPAKINLGLEILGKRSDGFHEIRSILAMTSLSDTLTFALSDSTTSVEFEGTTDVIDPDDNLIVSAIGAFNAAAGTQAMPHVLVEKRIPAAAGLGGASSDAAAALRAMQSLTNTPLSNAELHDVAAGLGSDVPFFLGSSIALVHGRGTELTPLPAVPGCLLIVMPDIAIDRKTTRLYGTLRPEDFSDGMAIEGIADMIRLRAPLPPAFPNAFDAAFCRLDERMASLVSRMMAAGVGAGCLSGAGPARFLHYPTMEQRDSAISALRPWLTPKDRLISCDIATGNHRCQR